MTGFDKISKAQSVNQMDSFKVNLSKYVDFVSWARWFPDLYFDLITPELGGIRLDLDQRVFLRGISRFLTEYGIFPRGYGKCVDGNTLIFTDNGIMKIKELFDVTENMIERIEAKNINIINRYGELEKSNYGIYSGYKDTIKITTEDGYSLESSLNHPILLKGENWVKTCDLKINDLVCINRANEIWGKLNNIVIYQNVFADVLNGDIHREILSSSRETTIDYINMLFKIIGINDKNNIVFKSRFENMINQLRMMLLNFGIITKTKIIDVENSKFFNLIISGYELDIYNSKIISKETDFKFNSNYFYSKIETLENNKSHVYDLQVPETNSFITNGYISHNTFLEILGAFHTAIFFPDIEIGITAQTKENASDLLRDKYNEIIKYYPLLLEEIVKTNFSRNNAEIIFTSGGVINILANHINSKGQRRKRLSIEESALLNNYLFQEVLEPIPNVPRRTIGKLSTINPEELNGQINFYTTAGFRNSDEFIRIKKLVHDMVNLKGKLVIGASWELACEYGRGETRSRILDKKETSSPIHFAQNYESKWTGVVDGALISINKLIELRVLIKSEIKAVLGFSYIMSVDVARSNRDSNNKTSISIHKLIFEDGFLKYDEVVYFYNLRNGLDFKEQSLELKKLNKYYNVETVVIDGNGVGSGLIDEVKYSQTDIITGEIYPSWGYINIDNDNINENAKKIVFSITSQGKNEDIILAFINMVESKKLRLLVKKQDVNYDLNDLDYQREHIQPFLETDAFINEVSNLKLVTTSKNKSLNVEKQISSIDKDRYSSVAYACYYIQNYHNVFNDSDKGDYEYDFTLR